jgi:hypothetical protein
VVEAVAVVGLVLGPLRCVPVSLSLRRAVAFSLLPKMEKITCLRPRFLKSSLASQVSFVTECFHRQSVDHARSAGRKARVSQLKKGARQAPFHIARDQSP